MLDIFWVVKIWDIKDEKKRTDIHILYYVLNIQDIKYSVNFLATHNVYKKVIYWKETLNVLFLDYFQCQ